MVEAEGSKMKINMDIEINNLGDAFKAIMFQRHRTYRDVADETGVALCTAWRFANRPFAIKADSFIALWRWMAIDEDELILFWEKETDRNTDIQVYPNFSFEGWMTDSEEK